MFFAFSCSLQKLTTAQANYSCQKSQEESSENIHTTGNFFVALCERDVSHEAFSITAFVLGCLPQVCPLAVQPKG